MELRPQNEKITYKGEDMLDILKELSFILCSLHDIGSCYADCIDEKRHEYEKETTDFIDDSRVCERLAHIRSKLTEGFDLTLGDDDMDDIERACCDIRYWSGNKDQQ